MITNFRQRSEAEKQLADLYGLSVNIKRQLKSSTVDETSLLEYIERQSQNLRDQIQQYDDLRKQPFPHLEVMREIANLPFIFISARIALGSILECAEKIQVHRQQLHRWETQNYSPITLSSMIDLANRFLPVLEAREEALREHAEWLRKKASRE